MRCQRVVVLKMIRFRSEGKIMKKIITAAVTYMLLMGSAYACQTTTIISGDKIIVCTVCGSLISCM
jgi:predicted transcriptional regulator